jgi:hypothetical protein
MMNTLSLQRQFTASSQSNMPFNPTKPTPKTAKVYLNSQDKMSGTNSEATFKVNLPCEFATQKLNLTLNNFIPIYPTNTLSGIVAVDMIGVENPYSYSSSTNTTHRTLGMFPLADGASREYPPVALTGTTTNISGQAYGNGTYTVSGDFGSPEKVFDKGNSISTLTGFYNYNTGVYTGEFSITATNGFNYAGGRVQLTLPNAIHLTSYSVQVSSDVAKSISQWVMLGSIDDLNWDLLHEHEQTNNTPNNVVSCDVNTSKLYDRFMLIPQLVGNTTYSAYRSIAHIAEIRLYGSSTPQTIPLTRIGQCNLNCEVITTDKTLFDRPITLQVKSLTGTDLSGLNNWSAELTIVETT